MKRGQRIPCVLYLYLHYKIYHKTDGGNRISTKEAISYLHHWKIPKSIRFLIIKEMEKLNLLKREGRNNLILNRPTFEIDKTYNYVEALKIVTRK